MGYIHDVNMSAFFPPSLGGMYGGTWSTTVDDDYWFRVRAAADGLSVIALPVILPQNSVSNRGSRLTSINIYYRIVTAEVDSLAAEVRRLALPANLTDFAAAEHLAFTYDSGHDTAALRRAVATHTMTLTITTPFFIDNDVQVYAKLDVDNSATSVWHLFGYRANYTLRI